MKNFFFQGTHWTSVRGNQWPTWVTPIGPFKNSTNSTGAFLQEKFLLSFFSLLLLKFFFLFLGSQLQKSAASWPPRGKTTRKSTGHKNWSGRWKKTLHVDHLHYLFSFCSVIFLFPPDFTSIHTALDFFVPIRSQNGLCWSGRISRALWSVWYGVVWCGLCAMVCVVAVVWCGLCGVVWCGLCAVVWCGLCGVVWCGLCGVVWCGVPSTKDAFFFSVSSLIGLLSDEKVFPLLKQFVKRSVLPRFFGLSVARMATAQNSVSNVGLWYSYSVRGECKIGKENENFEENLILKLF